MNMDAADRTIVSSALIACAREMGEKLFRTAFSTVVREARDASAAVLDRQGRIVSQADLIPMHLGSMERTARSCLEAYPRETWRLGDFFMTNDPYRGGQHLPDIYVFTPVLFDDEAVGFTATVAHHIEIGGGTPGPNMAATDVHQEGIIIPPTKLNLDYDWHGGPFERLLAANLRIPEQTIGDLNAQLAANSVGAARLRELCAKYGVATIQEVMGGLIDYSERRFRAAIAAVPDGVWDGEDSIDDDGFSEEPRTVRVRVAIRGAELTLDFTGTDQQLRSNMNAPLSSTASAALSCIKSVLTDPDIPFNSGCCRPVRLIVPEGTMLNPRYPAPNRARMEVCYRVHGAVMRALAKAVPDRVIAGGFDSTVSFSLSRLGKSGFQVAMEVFGGGLGASAENDGCDAVDCLLSNCSNIPVESLDIEYPYFRVMEYALNESSFGRGRHRGGMGLRRRYRIVQDEVQFVIYADRFKIPPPGLNGGEPGKVGRLEVTHDGQRELPAGKYVGTLNAGDEICLMTGGGGGYGTPAADVEVSS